MQDVSRGTSQGNWAGAVFHVEHCRQQLEPDLWWLFHVEQRTSPSGICLQPWSSPKMPNAECLMSSG